jgi:radical SAM superfamily enzyme YgiQ (UPF0313 family)
MLIEIVLPPLFINPDSQGFNEMLASEITAVANQNNIQSTFSCEYANTEADIYIYPVQYREDVLSNWLIDSIKKTYNRGLKIVCGKSSSVEYKYILTNSKADCVILGEIESTLNEIICKYNFDIKFLDLIDGIAYKKNSQIHINKLREAIVNLDNLPFAKYEYLNEKSKYPLCVMETSRSCHGKCNFCEGYLFRRFNLGNEYRVKSPERVIEEIKFVINEYGYRIFSFSDDNFFSDGNYGNERALRIANKLIDEKIRIRYTIECRADDIDYKIFSKLKQSGLCKVFIGIESGSQEVLNRYNKGTTIEDNRNAINVLQELKIKCHPGHILFDPLTTEKELIDTVNFFEPFLNNLFSFDEGYDSRLLFFPNGCEIVKEYWPNMDDEFYEKIYYEGIICNFRNEKTLEIFNKFNVLLRDINKYSNCNLLQRRIFCLKEAINIVENGEDL